MFKKNLSRISLILGLITFISLTFSFPALAHHAFEGKTPTNFVEAFISGLAHPIIGIDHFAFVVASGLLAIQQIFGIFIPIAFVVAAMGGTILHLLQWNLPFPEIAIALSVIIFGLMIVLKSTEYKIPSLIMIILAAIAGIFHGYAYGESIVGAEMNPLIWYLIGFTTIQLGVAFFSLFLGNIVVQKSSKTIGYVGMAISAIGMVFLAQNFT